MANTPPRSLADPLPVAPALTEYFLPRHLPNPPPPTSDRLPTYNVNYASIPPLSGQRCQITMDPFNTTTPVRKLRTYGRASRTATTPYTASGRTSSTQTPDPFTSKEPSASAVAGKPKPRATRSDRTKHVSSAARPPGPPTARRSSGGAPTPAKKKRDQADTIANADDVFDFPSSEDELQTTAELWRKRRRLSTPAASSSSRRPSLQAKRVEVPGPVAEPRRLRKGTTPVRKQAPDPGPVPVPVRRESKRLKTPAKARAQREEVPEVEAMVKTPAKARAQKKEVPEVEVMVKTPAKTRATARKTAEGTVPMPTIAESKTPLKRALDTGETKTQGLLDEAFSRPLRSRHIFDVPKLEPTQRPQILGSPVQKLRNITKHLSPIKKPGQSVQQAPGTVSRTRLVDALGSKRRYSSDSSDSESGGRRSISRSPSAVLDEPDHHGLTNPRRAPASSQKLTYARQRSFLTEANRGDGGEIDPLGDLTTPLIPESPPKLAKFNSSTSWDLDEDDDGNATRTIRSVYELRQAGSNARHQGVIETIFEDLEDESASVSCKRSGLMQLCSRLGDYQFAHKFLTSSLDKRLAKCTSGLSDVVSAFLLAYIYALLLSTGPASPIVLRTCNAQIARVAPLLLREKRDIMTVAKHGDAKMTKAGYNDLNELQGKMPTSKVWAETKPRMLSPQVLALRCTELTIRRIRETGDTVDALTIPVLRQVVELLLQQELTDKPDDLLTLELSLSILESYTVGVGQQLEPRQESILRSLSQLGPLLADLTRRSKTSVRRRQLQGLEIRLILNITNNNSRLCEDFSTPELIRALSDIVLTDFGSVAEELQVVAAGATTVATGKGKVNGNGNVGEKKESLLDTVILALGALINLTEWSGQARELAMELRTDGDTTLLDGFVRLFREGWEGVSEVCRLPACAARLGLT